MPVNMPGYRHLNIAQEGVSGVADAALQFIENSRQEAQREKVYQQLGEYSKAPVSDANVQNPKQPGLQNGQAPQQLNPIQNVPQPMPAQSREQQFLSMMQTNKVDPMQAFQTIQGMNKPEFITSSPGTTVSEYTPQGGFKPVYETPQKNKVMALERFNQQTGQWEKKLDYWQQGDKPLNKDEWTLKRDKDGNISIEQVGLNQFPVMTNESGKEKLGPSGGMSMEDRMSLMRSKLNTAVKTGGLLDPETVQYWSERMAAGDQMPAMGMGGMAARAQLLRATADRAREAGNTGRETVLLRDSYKANDVALKDQTKRYNAIRAFSNGAQKAIDFVKTLPYDRTQVPAANRFKNWIATNLTSTPKLASLEVGIYTAARDYAKATSGGAASVAEISIAAQKKADELINAAQAPEVLAAALDAMGNDMSRIVGAQGAQIQSIRTDMQDVLSRTGGKQSTTVQPNQQNQKDNDPLGIR